MDGKVRQWKGKEIYGSLRVLRKDAWGENMSRLSCSLVRLARLRDADWMHGSSV
jgi:hypothetical protein